MTEENNSQVSLNAEAFSRDASDDESALRSNWGSDDDSTECLGDGRPRGDPDGLRDQPQAPDDPQDSLLPQSGAQAPDFIRGYDALTEDGRATAPVDPLPQAAAVAATTAATGAPTAPVSSSTRARIDPHNNGKIHTTE